jgi:hypothetical protein
VLRQCLHEHVRKAAAGCVRRVAGKQRAVQNVTAPSTQGSGDPEPLATHPLSFPPREASHYTEMYWLPRAFAINASVTVPQWDRRRVCMIAQVRARVNQDQWPPLVANEFSKRVRATLLASILITDILRKSKSTQLRRDLAAYNNSTVPTVLYPNKRTARTVPGPFTSRYCPPLILTHIHTACVTQRSPYVTSFTLQSKKCLPSTKHTSLRYKQYINELPVRYRRHHNSVITSRAPS